MIETRTFEENFRTSWLKKSPAFIELIGKKYNELERMKSKGENSRWIDKISDEITILENFYNETEKIIDSYYTEVWRLKLEIKLWKTQAQGCIKDLLNERVSDDTFEKFCERIKSDLNKKKI
ncbi:MAG: hypothetical protein K2X86_18415 [Cytophagaceae bacterium]|nr:hypothetical protein [Cytophagaceae bacterium]